MTAKVTRAHAFHHRTGKTRLHICEQTQKLTTLESSVAQKHRLASQVQRKLYLFPSGCIYAMADIRCASGIFTTSLPNLSSRTDTVATFLQKNIAGLLSAEPELWTCSHMLPETSQVTRSSTEMQKQQHTRQTDRQESKNA